MSGPERFTGLLLAALTNLYVIWAAMNIKPEYRNSLGAWLVLGAFLFFGELLRLVAMRSSK